MFLTGARVLDGSFRFVRADLEIEDGKIRRMGEGLPYSPEDLVVDCQGYTIVPGFVDVHVHGRAGADTCDGTREAIDTMAMDLIRHGVTSFCPTTMTVGQGTIEAALLAAKACYEAPAQGGARVVGVNMEGPFIAEERKGAQQAAHILPPDFSLFRHFQEVSGGIVRLVDIAPEQPGGFEFIQRAKELCAVSIAHTTADYDTAKRSFDLGVTHATHLFNAMSGLGHRAPGVVGAVFDDDRVLAELICDGLHIHPAVLRAAFQILGDRAMVVSDCMRAGGLPEGEAYELGGQDVFVRDGKATLADGTLAGSVTDLHQEVKNLVRFGIPLERAVKAASWVPAKSIGLEKEIGSVEPGKRADLVVLDDDLEIVGVYHE